MTPCLLVTGGARSGKSRYAETRTRAWPGQPVYVATAAASDDEMRARISQHKTDRGAGWILHEEQFDIAHALDATDGAGPRLVDCLTIWLSNLILSERDWQAAVADLSNTLSRQRAPVVLVTNEVGSGIVPDNALARGFSDAAGMMNQAIGAAAGEVVLVVCGQPLTIKRSAQAH